MRVIRPFLPYFRYLGRSGGSSRLGLIFGVLFGISSGFGIPTLIHKVFPVIFGQLDLWALIFACGYRRSLWGAFGWGLRDFLLSVRRY